MTNHEVLPLLGQVADSVSQAIAHARPELAGADPVVRADIRALGSSTFVKLRQSSAISTRLTPPPMSMTPTNWIPLPRSSLTGAEP